ncbi:MAG: immune inhibitor A [candidate division Zixibacteria bacterium]|nr:immune inhibitor A [candidate division Zixibacteria bacterium]
MKHITVILIILLSLTVTAMAGKHFKLGNIEEDSRVTVEQSNDMRTVIRFDVGGFTAEAVEIDGEKYYKIECAKEGALYNVGEPALPKICRSMIISDDAKMRVNVLSAEYKDFPSMAVIPSKGHFSRTINPDDVPYTFGGIYGSDNWYPSLLAKSNEPYILRDYRGMVVEIHPFQYNPAEKTLRVYSSITVEVIADGSGEVNVFDRHKPLAKVTPDFKLLYQRRFINYNYSLLTYTPVVEQGDILIITADVFHDAMMPLVEWKRQKGIKTTIIDVSDIGNQDDLIHHYIQDFYDSTDLAFVLLVGDYNYVDYPESYDGASDPSYAKLAGNDHYPDIFVGRFSAESVADVQTQVERTVNYEKYPQGTDWHHMGTGIASTGGPGHHGEYDYEHEDYIRDDLLAYSYTHVDQIYDPGASAGDVTAAVNAGRGIINYTGHGSITSWSTTDFSNSHVNALTNENMLPFIISVACQNGWFNGYTCFGEAWLRATNNGNPTGAIAAYMSSINQDWNPPMDAQDEAVDLLVAETMSTFGGICYNGSCLMLDLNYNDSGIKTYDTWHIFGDPSVQLFTDTPTSMTVNHDNSVIFNISEINIEVVGIENALGAIYYNGTLYGSAYTGAGGMAVIPISEELPIGENVTLTVTAYNKVAYIANILVIAPDGPYVVLDSFVIDDSNGNNNGEVDFGESVLLDATLVNVGPDQAYSVSANLGSTDSHTTINDGSEFYGDIDGDYGTASADDAYSFDVASNTPDGHLIAFELEINDSTSIETWTSYFSIPVHAPDVDFVSLIINDETGNGNGILEAGETADIVITLINNGSAAANTVNCIISEDDEMVSITDANGTFGNIAPDGGTADNHDDVFTVVADDDFPQGHSVVFNLEITAAGGYVNSLDFELRTAESFEFNDGGYSGSGSWQWGEPNSGPNEAYYGVNVWGTNLGGDYPLNCHDVLISASMIINSPAAQFEFYHWYDMENSYDGGNVSISTNGGASWNLLTPEGGYPDMYIYSLNEPGYTNTSSGWERANFGLDDYAGQVVQFRWLFGSDSYINKAGWYIDDVALTNNLPQNPPELSINPISYSVTAASGELITRDLILANNGEGPLYFSLSAETDDSILSFGNIKKVADAVRLSSIKPLGYHNLSDKPGAKPEPYFPPVNRDQGGPDAFGYSWKDSNEPAGPTYSWIDITSIGTPITGLGDDTNVGPFSIGFNFEFYGNLFNTFRLSTNGFMSFTSTVTDYSNDQIPTNGSEPVNLIAPLWDDLNFNNGGSAYYYSNGVDSLIISWIGVPHYGDGGPYTFQIILLSNGKIYFQYQDINMPNNSATIGIQNGNGSVGLQVVYNAPYVQNNLAIEFKNTTRWLFAEPTSGTIEAHDSLIATITFDASELPEAIYTGSLILTSNDPTNPNINIPVTFDVGGAGFPIIVVSPMEISDTLIQGQQAAHDIIVYNIGTAGLIANFSTEENWISLSDSIFTIAESGQDTLVVALDASALAIGEYIGGILGMSNASDTPFTIIVALTVEEAYVCDYVPGDINGDGNVIGADVIYGINYFRGASAPPPDSCYNDSSEEWLYVAGDANGNCQFLGSDITYLISYFRGFNPPPAYCPALPPSSPAVLKVTKEKLPVNIK